MLLRRMQGNTEVNQRVNRQKHSHARAIARMRIYTHKQMDTHNRTRTSTYVTTHRTHRKSYVHKCTHTHPPNPTPTPNIIYPPSPPFHPRVHKPTANACSVPERTKSPQARPSSSHNSCTTAPTPHPNRLRLLLLLLRHFQATTWGEWAISGRYEFSKVSSLLYLPPKMTYSAVF